MYSSKLKGKFSERDIKIMQKAKAYGVTALSNEQLAKELFGLTFKQDLSKGKIDGLLKFYRACDKSVEVAQLSS
jgi:hypothetical protein